MVVNSIPWWVLAATSPWNETDWTGQSGSNVKTSVAGEMSISPTSSWYNASWSSRRKITFDNSSQAENLTNFVVMVKLDSTRVDYAKTQGSGQDIRFTDSDGTTLLSYEIEKWDESGTSTVWVEVPQIDASSATDYIYMYYGNTGATDAQDATNTWGSQIRYHLKETTSTDVNQFKASGYFDTGKLSQAVSMYGNAAGTSGSLLTFNRGAQVSGNNYEHINANQGTISFWVKSPTAIGSISQDQYLFDFGDGTANRIALYMDASEDDLTLNINGTETSSTGITFAASTYYYITILFNFTSDSYTVYQNGSSVISSSTAFTAPTPAAQNYIGSTYTGTNQAQALIDDFAIFDRVLTTTEITNLYNSGTGRQAGYVADPSLKFYVSLDGSGTLSPVTYNLGGNVDQTAYNSSTNTNGTMLTDWDMETAGTTNWPSQLITAITGEKNTTTPMFDTQDIKVTRVGGAGAAITQTITVTPSTNYTVSFWKKDDASIVGTSYVLVYDVTNASSIETLAQVRVYTPTRYESSFKTAANTTQVRIYLYAGNTVGDITYFDNIQLTPNSVLDGGMEGTLTDSWTQETNATMATDTSEHTGAQEMKITAGAANVGAKQSVTLVSGNHYLVSAWARVTSGDTAVLAFDPGSGTVSNITTSTATSYTRLSGVVKATGTAGVVYLRGSANTDIVWFDDVTITPLDNIAGSFQSWTSVTDAVGNNPLSVQGDSDGASSNTSGQVANAYTFDGATGFLRQKTYDINLGTLTYADTNTDIGDTGQEFEEWDNDDAGSAEYMIVVTNSDNTTSWGYFCANDGGVQTAVYTKKACTGGSEGFNGTSPSGKTPVGYEVRKSDFNITGTMTIGGWVKTTSISKGIISKYDSSGATTQSYLLHLFSPGRLEFYSPGATSVADSVSSYGDDAWHYLTAVFSSGSSAKLYIDGGNTETITDSSVGAAMTDVSAPFVLANRSGYTETVNLSGTLDEIFVLSGTALTASQIAAQYKSEVDTFNTYASEEAYYPTATFTSSIFDAGWSSNWGTLTYTATTPSNTTATVRVRTSNSSSMSGATDFSSCSAISSGSDISSNGCVTDGHRYGQYYVTLSSSDGVSTPTFSDFGLTFANAVSPTGSISIGGGATYSTSTAVTLTLSASDDVDSASGIDMFVSNNSDFSTGSYEDYATSKSWTLASTTDGSQTVYVKFRDANSNESSTYSDSITLDSTAPASFDLESPGDASYTSNSRPTFKWKVSSDGGSGLSHYQLFIDNGDTGDITIDSIPLTADYTTSKYVIDYDSSGYISVYTKSSSSWESSQNDGKVKEGERSFRVTAYDSAGNGRSHSRIFYADQSSPTLTATVGDDKGSVDGYQLINTNQPTFTGTITDNLNIEKLVVSYYKQNLFLGIITSEELVDQETLSRSSTTSTTNTATSWSYSFKTSKDLTLGKYKTTVAALDKAGNQSSQEFSLNLLTLDKINLLLAQEGETPTSGEGEGKISIPDLEKQAIIRRELEAKELTNLKDQILTLLSPVSGFLANLLDQGGTLLETLAEVRLPEVRVPEVVIPNLDLELPRLAINLPEINLPEVKLPGINLPIIKVDYTAITKTSENLADSSAELAESINRPARELKDNIDSFVENSVATIIQSGQDLASNYEEGRLRTIQKANDLWPGEKLVEATDLVLREIRKPVDKTNGFVEGVRIVYGTAMAVFFDKEPTKISDVTVEEVGDGYAIISFKTNHFAYGKVNYGETLAYGEEVDLPKREKIHKAKLTGLKKGGKYFFEVMAQNKNYAYDAYYTLEIPE